MTYFFHFFQDSSSLFPGSFLPSLAPPPSVSPLAAAGAPSPSFSPSALSPSPSRAVSGGAPLPALHHPSLSPKFGGALGAASPPLASGSSDSEPRRRAPRALTGRHVRAGTGASPRTLEVLRKKLLERQRLKELLGEENSHLYFGALNKQKKGQPKPPPLLTLLSGALGARAATVGSGKK